MAAAEDTLQDPEVREAAKAERAAYLATPEGKLTTRAQQLSGDYGDVRQVDPKNVPAIEALLTQIGTENEATRAIAATLAQKYGITDLNQVGTRQGTKQEYNPNQEAYVDVPATEYYNKVTNSAIPQNFATYDNGKATYHFGLDTTKDGNLTFNQPQEPTARAKGMKNEAMMALALASLAFDWTGTTGYAILGAGDAVAGAVTAGEMAASISAATGITVPANAIATGIGAATVNTATTYARTGSFETAVAAGASSFVTGVGAAAAGGTVGDILYNADVNKTLTNYLSSAVAGAAGTALAGGSVDLSKVVNGALATAASVGVTNAATPFVGVDVAKGLGAATQTYITTGDPSAAVQNGLFSGVGSAIRSATSQTPTVSTGDTGADAILKASESVGRVPGTGLQVASADDATQYTLPTVTVTASKIDQAFEQNLPDWLKQIVATSAQGFGQQIETFANAYSAITGKSFSNTMADFGHNMSIWGANRDSTDLAAQTRAFDADIKKAESLPWYQSPAAIVQSAIKNPLGAFSKIGQERIQEVFPALAGVVTAAAGVYFGAPVATAVALGAAGSALVDAFENLGSGTKEAYDIAKKNGATEQQARNTGILNGVVHALVTLPVEYIGDKALFKSYTDGITKGITGFITQYGSANVREFGKEVLETYGQTVSTAATTGQKFDPRAAVAQSFTAGLVASGTHAGMTSEGLIKDAVVAKDFSGKSVTLGEMMSGSKLVDPSTIKADAVIGTSANGTKQTLGYATAVARDLGVTAPQLAQVLPPAMLSNDLVIATLPGGTPVTMADFNRFEQSGGTPETFVESLTSADPVTFARTYVGETAGAAESQFKTQTFFDSAVDQKIAAGASPLDATKDALSSMGLTADSINLTALGKTLGGQSNAVAAIKTPTVAPTTAPTTTAPTTTAPATGGTTAPITGGTTAPTTTPTGTAPVVTTTPAGTTTIAGGTTITPGGTTATPGVTTTTPTLGGTTTGGTTAVTATPTGVTATTPAAQNTIGADVAAGAIRSAGIDPTGMTPAQMTDALAKIEPGAKFTVVPTTAAATATTAATGTGNNAATNAANNAATAVTTGVDPAAATNAAVTTAVNNGANTNAATNAAVTGAVTAGANPTNAVTGAVNAATAAGTNPTTATTVATNAATNAATNTATNVATNTAVDPNVNPNINTNVNTNVNPNVSTTTTTAAGGTTGAVAPPAAVAPVNPALAALEAQIAAQNKTIADQEAARKAAEDEANRVASNQRAEAFLKLPSKPSSNNDLPAVTAAIIGGKSGFVSPLEAFSKMVRANEYVPQQQQPEGALMRSSHYSYGQPTDLNEILGLNDEGDQVEQQAKAGGLMTPLMATGGTTRYGKFAGGGLNVVHHAGKMRVDFRHGDAVTGAGDGQSDDIPAMLADGEFVIPADVVAALGNGSTKAGSDALYEMMHSIRARARKGHPKSLPPPAKSPLDYISKRK